MLITKINYTRNPQAAIPNKYKNSQQSTNKSDSRIISENGSVPHPAKFYPRNLKMSHSVVYFTTIAIERTQLPQLSNLYGKKH